jgi:hypothetical protein
MSIKSALQRDLDRFFGKLNGSSFSVREATKGALSQARQKLDPWAFQRLNKVSVDIFYCEADYYGWECTKATYCYWIGVTRVFGFCFLLDFFSKVFLMSLCAAYAFPIEEKVREEYKADKDRKHDQKINRTNTLSVTQDILIAVFLKHQFQQALKAFDNLVETTREIIRPGRSFIRKKKPKKPYSMTYKRL